MPLTDQQRKDLVKACLDVRKNAHAPYSKFHVGAAILTQSGKIITGCNMENASYGLTICAERGAACTAIAMGEKKWVAIAVSTPGGFTPCGACRQVIAEFGPDIPVLIVDADKPDTVRETDMETLLPGRFIFSTDK